MDTSGQSDPYIVVSSDAHVGPSLEHQLREYCPKEHLEAYDDFVRTVRAGQEAAKTQPNRFSAHATTLTLSASDAIKDLAGPKDPHAFLRDLDHEGIAATVVFSGAGNDEVLPFVGGGFGAGSPQVDGTMRTVGNRMWNRWIADFVSVSPKRLLGVIQTSIWDITSAIEEVYWGKEHGLRVVNFPAPRRDYPSFNDPSYEPFWSAVEEVDLPLVCHGGSGVNPFATGPGNYQIFSSEVFWHSRRGFTQLALGGVFDRHPRLRVGFTEQRGGWIPEFLRNLDSTVLDPQRSFPDNPKRLPSEYWRSNCFVGCSYMAHFEAELRNEIGIETVTWGADYPHVEGTWGRTQLALRNTFAGIPHQDVRTILTHNPARIYTIDEADLRDTAASVCPTPDEIDQPLLPEEFPTRLGLAFRKVGEWA